MDNRDKLEELNKALSQWSDDTDGEKNNSVWGEVYNSGILVIHIGGTTLVSDTSDIVNQICNLMRDIEGNVILDLGACNYLSSMTLGAIAQLAVEYQSKNLRVVIASANDKIKQLIKLLDLGEILGLYDTVEEAVESF